MKTKTQNISSICLNIPVDIGLTSEEFIKIKKHIEEVALKRIENLKSQRCKIEKRSFSKEKELKLPKKQSAFPRPPPMRY